LLVASAAALAAALLAGCGGSSEDKAGGKKGIAAGAAHYADALGDGGAAPDIRAVDVRRTPDGRLTFRVSLGGPSSSSKTGVDLWLDTDADPETGNTSFEDAGGAEYLLSAFIGFKREGNPICGLVAGGDGCISLNIENGWSAASAPTARISRTKSGVTISINRSDLGDTNELNFYAIGWSERADLPDRAPGAGTFNYSLALGGPRMEASTAPSARGDKAGGKSDSGPVVLTLASHDYNAIDASEFASAVERLSGGSIRIDVKYGVRQYDVEYEQGTIMDVRNAVYDLALVGARAWDAASVKSFNALVAPFLVDSYALERRVLQSSLSERMLERLERLGLVGIAVVPGELRRPLGLSRALARPADFRGARIGIRPSSVARATFDALGADAEGFQSIPNGLLGFDGAESGVSTILNNRYDSGARALTANVVLWARPATIFMNRKSFDALSGEQQEALRRAGRETIEPVLATIRESEHASLEAICNGSGLPLVLASPSDRAALRRAVEPVYEKLERDSLTRELIAEIEDLRGNEDAADEPLRCPHRRPRSNASALDGAWRIDVTRDDLRATGAQLEQFQRAEGPWRVEFDGRRWVARNLETGNVYRGTYAVEGDMVRETVRSCNPADICITGAVEEYSWSVYRDKLKLGRIPGRSFNVAMIAKPLTRIR
jgi:TRAP-type C4-dicarboxylate transport system substrate-binding protein